MILAYFVTQAVVAVAPCEFSDDSTERVVTTTVGHTTQFAKGAEPQVLFLAKFTFRSVDV